MPPERIIFWKIGEVWVFYLLAGFSVCLFLVGVVAHISMWLKATEKRKVAFSRQALKETISDVFLGLRVLKGEVPAGIMHALIFWGFFVLSIGTTLLLIHEHLYSFLVGRTHLVFEVSMEIGGLMLLAGITWALVRRYFQRVHRLEHRLEDALLPLWLLLVIGSGFILEGSRLAAQQPPWGNWSFAGSWVGSLLSNSTAESAYPYLWWSHGLLSLGFIAVIPFSKLFHILGAPAAYYFHHLPKGPKEALSPFQELGEGSLNADDQPLDFGEAPVTVGDVAFFDACMRCGRCVDACPSSGAGEPFAPREFVQATLHALWQENSPVGDIRFLTKDLPMNGNVAWYCTTCAACLEVCPVYGATFEAVTRMRTKLVLEGKGVPDLMNQTLERLFNYENPWVASKRERAGWTKGLDIPTLTKTGKEVEFCYFVGCTTSFDARAQVIARSFASILNRAGVSFGILAEKEPCCGDIARVVGESGLFQEEMQNCSALFDDHGVMEVVTSSPHCFHTFLNEYSERRFGVRHYTSIVRELIANESLKFEKLVKATVTYHDPCYLGRHNGIFEEPREVIRSIPGIKFIEMKNHGHNSLCCGGGGGRMWQGPELRGEARMGEIRIREARETGAEILITACPLCLIMLEDALKTLGLDGQLRVMDLNELVLNSLEP
jgi:Fe-S oxidoreductase/nitrate reductase gamma subunit